MLTYLIRLDNDLTELIYNCSVNKNQEDKTGYLDKPGRETIVLGELPDGFMDNDWVYFDAKGNLCLIDDRPLEPIYKEYSGYRDKYFMGEEFSSDDMAKYELAKQKYEEYMMNPVILDIEETKEYIKEREAFDE